MKTLVLAPFASEALSMLTHLGTIIYEPWTQTQKIWDPEELGERIHQIGVDGLIVEIDFLFDELFANASSLRIAAICRSALNHVDLTEATQRKIAIIHTPGRNARAVAEMVIAQMFAVARHITEASSYVNEGRWVEPTEAYIRFQGRELKNATLGIVGFGHIGTEVAKMARSLGMRVLVYDPYVKPTANQSRWFKFCDLDAIFSDSDIVSVHVPETEETRGLVSQSLISKMRRNACLINVASPSVVDGVALANSLRDGRLAGAAMDVHDSHPLANDSPFLGLPNVILTPHIGGATMETIKRHSDMVTKDFFRFFAGQRPKNLANPQVWQTLKKRPV